MSNINYLDLITVNEVTLFSPEQIECGISPDSLIVVSSFLNFIFIYQVLNETILRKKIEMPISFKYLSQCHVHATQSVLTIYLYAQKVYTLVMSLPLQANTPAISEYELTPNKMLINPINSELILFSDTEILNLNGDILVDGFNFQSPQIFAFQEGTSLQLYVINFGYEGITIQKIVDFVLTDTQTFSGSDQFQSQYTRVLNNQYFFIPGYTTSALISKDLQQITYGLDYLKYNIAFFMEADSKVMMKSGLNFFLYTYSIQNGVMSLENLLGEYEFYFDMINYGGISRNFGEFKVDGQYYFFDRYRLFHESATVSESDSQLFYPNQFVKSLISFPRFSVVGDGLVFWTNTNTLQGKRESYKLSRIVIKQGQESGENEDDNEDGVDENDQADQNDSEIISPQTSQTWLIIVSGAFVLNSIILIVLLIWTCRKFRVNTSQVLSLTEDMVANSKVNINIPHS